LTSVAFIWILCLSPLFAETASPVSEGTEPEDLAINWKKDDAYPVVSPDGDYLIFSSDRPGSHEEFNFWYSFNQNAKDRAGSAVWTVPVPFRLPLSGEASDTMKILHPGGIAEEPGLFSVNSDGFESMSSIVWRKGRPVEVYFTSTAAARGQGFAGLNIYFTRFQDDRWSAPVQLSISSQFDDRMPSVSVDGEWLVFSSNRPGGYGGDDLYLSRRDVKTGKWSVPVNAGPAVNTAHNETSPSWSVDRGTLFFSSDRPGGIGHYDFYLSRLRENVLQPAENMGRPFNSERDDEGISFTEDRMWMYFASDRRSSVSQGGLDLYRIPVPDWIRDPVDVLFAALIMDSSTRLPLGIEATVQIQWPQGSIVRQSEKFNKGRDQKSPNFSQKLTSGREYRIVISAPGFYPQELLLDYRGNVPPGRNDVRTVLLEPVRKTTQEDEGRLIPGRIVDADTDLPLSGTRLRRIAKDTFEPIATDAKGYFQIRLKKDEKVSLRADAPAHTSADASFQESRDLREMVIRLKGQGDPCQENSPACIENIRILFALGSPEVSPDEKKKLDAIVRILKANPALKIEVRGHTDSTYQGAAADSLKYNMRLSEMRAKNVRELILKSGIDGVRISLKPVAYLEPEEPETSDRARSRNRRVEFRRLNLEK
jgi:peptidoglycan-associated lipoprotein